MSTITQDALTQLRRLSESQRLDARDKARANVIKAIGDKPQRAQFDHFTTSDYPVWFSRTIAAFMVIVFVAAGAPSLFRLFTAGRDYFLAGIADNQQAAIVGASTFLLAEFLIILSTIAASVYFQGRRRWMFIVPITLGLAMALVGNWQIAQPTDVFGWLETVSPPAAVLFIALIGERLALDAIRRKHANERAYQEALAEWKAATAEPESHDRWPSAYANALRQALWRANGRGSGSGSTARQELMQQLNGDDWRELVLREMKAENWFSADDLDAAQTSQNGATQPMTAHTGSNAVNPTQAPVTMTNGASSNGHR